MIGAVLISTVAGGIDPTIWIPVVLRPIARQAAAPMLRGVSRGPARRPGGARPSGRRATWRSSAPGTWRSAIHRSARRWWTSSSGSSAPPPSGWWPRSTWRCCATTSGRRSRIARPGAGDRDRRGAATGWSRWRKARNWPSRSPARSWSGFRVRATRVILERPEFVNSVISDLVARWPWRARRGARARHSRGRTHVGAGGSRRSRPPRTCAPWGSGWRRCCAPGIWSC